MSSEESDPLLVEVLRYFLDHPQAVDSMYGISRWRERQPAVRVDDALKRLVARGFLEEGPSRCYRLVEGRREEAANIVESHRP
jgi:hypothetical protein